MDNYNPDRAKMLVRMLMQLNRAHRAKADALAGSVDLHRSQHMILSYLVHNCDNQHDISQTEIAKEFDISPAAVAVTLKKLESGGYVSRDVNTGDNRYNRISVTPKGNLAISQIRNMFDEVDKAMFSEFTEQEFDTLQRCFLKMQDGLKKVKVTSDSEERE